MPTVSDCPGTAPVMIMPGPTIGKLMVATDAHPSTAVLNLTRVIPTPGWLVETTPDPFLSNPAPSTTAHSVVAAAPGSPLTPWAPAGPEGPDGPADPAGPLGPFGGVLKSIGKSDLLIT